MKVAPVNKGRRADGWQRVDADGKTIKAEALEDAHIQTAKLKDEKGFGEEYDRARLGHRRRGAAAPHLHLSPPPPPSAPPPPAAGTRS